MNWEYKIVRSVEFDEDRLNEYGNDGWQLTAVVFHERSSSGYDYFIYYFKRQKTESK